MAGIGADSVWPDKRVARRRFDAAASSFAPAAFVHDEARQRLLERLDFLRVDPASIVDLGCGPGAGAHALSGRYPGAQVVAVDSSPAMLAEVGRAGYGHACVLAEAEQLPFRDQSIDLLFANLLLPWCRPDVFAAEAARVLSSNGLLLVSTVGPDTLAELRLAWREVDERVHVHGFLDMHDLGDLLGRAGLAEPVMDLDRLTVTYPTLAALTDDLSACAGRNAAPGRAPGLTPRSHWRRFEAALENRRKDGRLGIGIELIFAQAWGRAGERHTSGRNQGEIAVPVDQIGRR